MTRLFQQELTTIFETLRLQPLSIGELADTNYDNDATLKRRLRDLVVHSNIHLPTTRSKTAFQKLLSTDVFTKVIIDDADRIANRVRLMTQGGYELHLQLRKKGASTKIQQLVIRAIIYDPDMCIVDVDKVVSRINATSFATKIKLALTHGLVQVKYDGHKAACERLTINLRKLLGRQFSSDGWSVYRFLGAGEFGTTWGVYKLQPDQTVTKAALKVVAEESREDIDKEIAMHGRFAGMSIAPATIPDMFYAGRKMGERRIYAYGMGEIQFLAKDVMQASIDPQHIRNFAQGLVSVLLEMEAKNIVHGDFHTENIAITENRVQLIDFGWSTHDRAWAVYDIGQFVRSSLIDIIEMAEGCRQTDWRWLCSHMQKVVNRLQFVFKSLDAHFHDRDPPFMTLVGDELRRLRTATLEDDIDTSTWNTQLLQHPNRVASAAEVCYNVVDDAWSVYLDEYRDMIS